MGFSLETVILAHFILLRLVRSTLASVYYIGLRFIILVDIFVPKC